MIAIQHKCKFFDSCKYADETSRTCTQKAGGDYCGAFRMLSTLQKGKGKKQDRVFKYPIAPLLFVAFIAAIYFYMALVAVIYYTESARISSLDIWGGMFLTSFVVFAVSYVICRSIYRWSFKYQRKKV